MRHRGFHTFFSILLVFVLTIAAVTLLSAISQASSVGGQLPAAEEAVEGLFAPVAGEKGIPLTASVFGFLAILVVPLTAYLCVARRQRRAKAGKRQGERQRYLPKKDMTFKRFYN